MQWKSQWNQVKYAQFEFQMNQKWGWFSSSNCQIYQLLIEVWIVINYILPKNAKYCIQLQWELLIFENHYYIDEVRWEQQGRKDIHFGLNSGQRLDASTIKWQNFNNQFKWHSKL